jgi:hypothetical protein
LWGYNVSSPLLWFTHMRKRRGDIMPSKLRSKLSYANVIATVCLFVVLGGSSLAAPVREAAKKLITGKQVKDNSLTTKDIKNASLLSKDFKAGQLPRGAQGPTGLVGPTGPRGAVGAKGDTGDNGLDGQNGQDGQDGSPDSGDDILTKLAGVDGAGSGLDADTLDGVDSKSFARLGGVVNGDGTIVQGTGFTVSRLSDGEYQVSFPAGTLSNAMCPPVATAMVFSGLVRNPQVSSRSCSGLGAGSFTVKTLDTSGVPHDTPFLFIAM